MSILVNKHTRLLVQGITGQEGLFHTEKMVTYGTKVVAGVTPGKGGEWVLNGKIPVFDSVQIAKDATGANATVIFVPARFAADAMFEAGDAGMELIVCITEGVPVADMMRVRSFLDQKDVRLVGPNCPGLLTPGEAKVGIIPGNIAIPGNVGVVSRSGTLTYEVLYALKNLGLGVSTCVGIGGDPVNGTNFIDTLEMFQEDPDTEKIVLIGEIGGTDEEQAAEYISKYVDKPVASFIAGRTAPPGKRMGHAGAIVQGGTGLAEDKIKALEEAGVRVAAHPEQIPELL
ncbi:MAG: succinate--CoA ligase subunit alpha [Anaerolineales bacterium]|jgi:succinyl-CoA synthetase alpha subunit